MSTNTNQSSQPGSSQPGDTWEDILNAYLEGDVLRADAEALRWKIRLPDEVRQQIDQDLRLADALESLGQSIAAPATGLNNLREALAKESTATAPAHWQWTPAGPCGTSGLTTGAVLKNSGDDDDEDDSMNALAGELMQLGKSIVPPSGALERLITRLHQEPISDSGGDEADDIADSQRPIRLFANDLNLAPDALAASKPDEPTTPPAGQKGADKKEKRDPEHPRNEEDKEDGK